MVQWCHQGAIDIVHRNPRPPTKERDELTEQTPDVRVESARVLVTGATSGVGEATVRHFASRGARVALLGRRADAIRGIADSIGELAHGIVADVADAAAAARAVDDAASTLGGLDVVVNAAGVADFAPLDELTHDRWQAVIDTNLTGTFTISRTAGLYMRLHGGGAIVNVASDLAHMGAPGLVHYCASKAGVVGLTRAMALELAPHVRVNVVCPGPIDTPMLRSGLEQEDDPRAALAAKEASIPLGRLSTPAEVAAAISYLAFDATFATGTSMAFDGGTSAA